MRSEPPKVTWVDVLLPAGRYRAKLNAWKKAEAEACRREFEEFTQAFWQRWKDRSPN